MSTSNSKLPHVLWIDDEPSRAGRFTAQLRSLGLHLDVATSLSDAHIQLSNKRYQLVLVDIDANSAKTETVSALRTFVDQLSGSPLIGVSSHWGEKDGPTPFPGTTGLLSPDGPVDWIAAIIEAEARRATAPTSEAPIQSASKITVVTLPTFDLALYRRLEQHPELLKTLDWRVFESLLAECLTALGYEVELQRGTKDGGIDIFAMRKDSVLGPHRYLLQAKRYADSVGVAPVRELLFLHDEHRVTKSCLATTSRFTRGAWELANQHEWKLELRDQDGLKSWLQKVVRNKSH